MAPEDRSVAKQGESSRRARYPSGPGMLDLPADYFEFLADLKNQIRGAQLRAAISVNRELIVLYWNIGRQILGRQQREGWGAKVIDRLAGDLSHAFPEMKGFSARNLKYMRALAEAYPDESFVQQAVAQIPWGHNVRILDYIKDSKERNWYVHQTILHGWSRNVLVHQIESGVYHRQGKALTNFDQTLPSAQSDLAHQILKDPYTFDFLTMSEDIRERDLERSLLQHLREFLIELGKGFAFVGSQYRLEVAGEEYFIDLLFYHLHLRCFVVIDLKVGKFEPEFAGKMTFYLSAADELLRHPDDQPSIGLILCKTRNSVVVEYTLRDISKPIGVTTYQIKTTESLPAYLKDCLPTVEDLEAELRGLPVSESDL